MNKEQCLMTAKDVICKERQDQYGNAENSFKKIAKLWSTYISTDNVVVSLSECDVAMMMVLLKVARASSNMTHLDNFVDICGYAALASEMAENGGGYRVISTIFSEKSK